MDQAIINIIYQFNGWGMGLYVLITTLISGVLSSLIGFERETKGQPAGLRTHVLLSIGCCLLMIVSIYAIGVAEGSINLKTGQFNGLSYDTSRIGAGIAAGIGFIGAGAIIKNGVNVRGLTTAATLWICSGLGMACGAGFVFESIITAAVALLVLIGLRFFEKIIYTYSPEMLVVFEEDMPVIKTINDEAAKFGIIVKNIFTDSITNDKGEKYISVKLIFAHKTSNMTIQSFAEDLASNPKVKRVTSKKYNKDLL